ncbi:phosphoribosylglycinamide formyltransferase [Parachitinimonas caeni]|uniref:Phosphoribosylglycinamide formyltransferase n=1 Tax=Parachitinimonas caeni TaxID=3031301 RepID=A0ABT7DVK2_9NEIS|nr:phosphoribosylglycinamide formyltransferase [Parachitinimonas caeni]MDK2123128.1 phosphoribosylglycinamide formyltransferase [Parachitinimonas caeni]
MKNIVILISGRGSNMQALVNARISGARIAAVISNRPDAYGLDWAKAQGIHTVTVDHTQYANRAEFDAALADAIDQFRPDLLILAGFMRILGAEFTQRYAGRLFNIHPSLLPAFPGLHTHQRAIDAGCKVAGCTVHFVTAELDHGPIVSQAVVPILNDDTAQSLAQRVLAAEHRIYPEAVSDFVQGHLRVEGMRVINTRLSDHSSGRP